MPKLVYVFISTSPRRERFIYLFLREMTDCGVFFFFLLVCLKKEKRDKVDPKYKECAWDLVLSLQLGVGLCCRKLRLWISSSDLTEVCSLQGGDPAWISLSPYIFCDCCWVESSVLKGFSLGSSKGWFVAWRSALQALMAWLTALLWSWPPSCLQALGGLKTHETWESFSNVPPTCFW